MFEIFRRNLFLNTLLLLPYVFIIRINSILQPAVYNKGEDTGLLSEQAYKALPDGLTQNILANLLIFIQALLLNYIFSQNRFSRESTLFPGVLYILFVSIMTDNNLLTPVLMANTFIILAILYLLQTYKVPNATAMIFNTGFMLSLSAQFYIPYFVFVLFGVVGLIMLRSFKIKEKLQYLIGFGIPYFLVFTYKYWFDIPFADLDFIKNIFFRFPGFRTDDLIVLYVSFGALMIAVALSVFNYGSVTGKKSLQVQKKADILYWGLLFCLISFLIFRTNGVTHLATLAVPLALISGTSLSDGRNSILNELMHIFLVALIMVSGFGLIKF